MIAVLSMIACNGKSIIVDEIGDGGMPDVENDDASIIEDSGAPIQEVCFPGGYQITNPDGVERLESFNCVRGDLIFQDNHYIAHLDLSQLVSIGGDLRISSNSKLEQLDLSNLKHVGGSVKIDNNPLLPQCQACNVLNSLVNADDREFEIVGNQRDMCNYCVGQ
jgi:hypothetical protein